MPFDDSSLNLPNITANIAAAMLVLMHFVPWQKKFVLEPEWPLSQQFYDFFAVTY